MSGEQFVVVLAEQGTVYGPLDHPTALQFAGYLMAEVDPAEVQRLHSPVLDLLGWRESVVLEMRKEAAEPAADAPQKPPRPEPSDAEIEVDAIGRAYEALVTLDFGAQLRALRWLGDRLDSDHRATQTDYDEEPPF